MRESGILMPVSSLASRFGIGCISREAYEFVDFLKSSGQGFWQILPVGQTGFGDSPYQSVSAFAGNPYFISPDTLIKEGLLTEEECSSCFFGSDQEQVDYGALYENRYTLLEKAFARFVEGGGQKEKSYTDFLKKEEYWLDDYALYMSLKKAHNGAGWEDWEDELKLKDKTAIAAAREKYVSDIDFYKFLQYKFYSQWEDLKTYASGQKVKIIGDMPFYVAMDSVDVWAHPECFLIDKDMKPTGIAGTPPDDFSPLGQSWGNPLYNWDKLKDRDYDWWIKRVEHGLGLYDVVRIDHFHGFSEYYSIPYKAEDATKGELKKGPGMDFFEVLYKRTDAANTEDCLKIIAEDLGKVTEENVKLLKDSGIPGMHVLQYAFTGWNSIYLPFKHTKNSVCYTGTHDNTTSRAWFEDIEEGQRGYVRRYTNSMNTDVGGFVWDFIREAYRSPSMLCIVPLQDYLVMGREARINEPGTQGNNWKWRLKPNFLSQELAASIRGLVDVYSRVPE